MAGIGFARFSRENTKQQREEIMADSLPILLALELFHDP